MYWNEVEQKLLVKQFNFYVKQLQRHNQNTTVRKNYNYLLGSSGLEIWKPEIFKSLALHAMISLVLLSLYHATMALFLLI